MPRWVDVLQLPRGVGSCGIGIFPLRLLWKRNGESFAPFLFGIPARNPGIVGREGPRLGSAHIWVADDPQQLQSTPEIVEFRKAMTTERKKAPGGPNEIFHPWTVW